MPLNALCVGGKTLAYIYFANTAVAKIELISQKVFFLILMQITVTNFNIAQKLLKRKYIVQCYFPFSICCLKETIPIS